MPKFNTKTSEKRAKGLNFARFVSIFKTKCFKYRRQGSVLALQVRQNKPL